MSFLSEYPRINEVALYAEQRINASAAQASSHPAFAGPAYRWQHTLRVTHYGIHIAQVEKAKIELVAAACLLHDSEWFSDSDQDDRGHGRLAARMIRPFLAQVSYSPDEVDNICYSVAVHVDGQAGYVHEHTLEAKIVSDADNIDRFGALRTIFWCIDVLDDYEALISKLTERVRRLEDYHQRQVLETEEGNRLFREKLELQLDFFRKLIAEHAITHFP